MKILSIFAAVLATIVSTGNCCDNGGGSYLVQPQIAYQSACVQQFVQPVYAQPVYAQPVYAQPVYAQPVIAYQQQYVHSAPLIQQQVSYYAQPITQYVNQRVVRQQVIVKQKVVRQRVVVQKQRQRHHRQSVVGRINGARAAVVVVEGY